MYYSDTLPFPSQGQSNYRIPTVVTTNRGTVLAFCSNRIGTLADHADVVTVVLRRKPADGPWEAERTLLCMPGWSCNIGAAVYDAQTDTVFLEVCREAVAVNEFGDYTAGELEALKAKADAAAAAAGVMHGWFFLRSGDDGITWHEMPKTVAKPTVLTDADGNTREFTGFTHGSGAGIRLRRGPYAGRLVMPARFMTGRYTSAKELKLYCYNNAIYSDDHGESWCSSAPVQRGTGEGVLFEDGEGIIRYNSRGCYFDGKRYLAESRDGGETFGEFSTDRFLREVTECGCNAAILRVEREDLSESDAALLPEGSAAVTVFVNPRHPHLRRDMTACISFDEGRTWQEGRHLRPEWCAYSSMAFSAADRHFYILYELGEESPYDLGLTCTECDLAWLLG